ncbi:hypothetical protein VTL71DRAFT_254 [Oculimacula yallundae]|uniref:Rhodopsin domain-containing protein n=1 Tax=Oculimacula yallundae TaxID=86028 RepID=A0ABR4CZM5_9HELO
MDTSYLEYVLASPGIDPTDHHSNSGSVIWTSSVLCITVFLMTIARLRVRWNLGTYGRDDAFIVGATFITLLFTICSIHGARQGLGKHIYDILLPDHSDPKLEATQSIAIPLFGSYVAYNLAIALVKLSIIASYLRIIPNMIFRRIMWGVGTSVVLLAVVECLTVIFECNPPESSWNWGIKRKYCINIPAFFYAVSSINTATDFGLWGAPLWFFLKSQMPRKKKVELGLLYVVGLAGCLFGLFRIGYLKGLTSPDITYTGALPLNNSMAEVCLGIIAANIPPLRPAFRIFRPVLEFFRPVLEWFRPVLEWFRPMLKWFRPMLEWFRPMRQWFQKLRGSPPVSIVPVDKETPANTPQVDVIPHFERRRTMSRVEAYGKSSRSDDIEMGDLDDDDFEGGFRQYLGSSMSSCRNTPSVTGTFGERGSATSVNDMV